MMIHQNFTYGGSGCKNAFSLSKSQQRTSSAMNRVHNFTSECRAKTMVDQQFKMFKLEIQRFTFPAIQSKPRFLVWFDI